MIRRRFECKRLLIEVYEEITSSCNWIVPAGCESVDAFVVAGGRNGSNSGPYHAGNGGAGGGCYTFKNIQVTPGTSIPIGVGTANEHSYFWDTNYRTFSGNGGSGGTNYQNDGLPPTNGKPGGSGTYAFDRPSERFPHRYGAGGGAGAYIRGHDKGYFYGGAGGDYGGGAGAGDNDNNGIHNGRPGGNATFYGGGGGGASKASGLGSQGGAGGKGYQGIVILHYWKYRY